MVLDKYNEKRDFGFGRSKFDVWAVNSTAIKESNSISHRIILVEIINNTLTKLFGRIGFKCFVSINGRVVRASC